MVLNYRVHFIGRIVPAMFPVAGQKEISHFWNEVFVTGVMQGVGLYEFDF